MQFDQWKDLLPWFAFLFLAAAWAWVVQGPRLAGFSLVVGLILLVLIFYRPVGPKETFPVPTAPIETPTLPAPQKTPRPRHHKRLDVVPPNGFHQEERSYAGEVDSTPLVPADKTAEEQAREKEQARTLDEQARTLEALRGATNWHLPVEGPVPNSLIASLSRHSWGQQPTVLIADNGTWDSERTALALTNMFRGAGWEVHMAGWGGTPSAGPIPPGLSMETAGIPKDDVVEIADALTQALGAQAVIVEQYPDSMQVLNQLRQQTAVNLVVTIGARAESK